jgi:hypothetical protein
VVGAGACGAPPVNFGVLRPVLSGRPGSIGGPVRTGCGWIRWRGWYELGGIVGAEPAPNRLGGIAGTMTDVTKVKSTMAVTMTALGAANPAGCARAAAMTDREVVCIT